MAGRLRPRLQTTASIAGRSRTNSPIRTSTYGTFRRHESSACEWRVQKQVSDCLIPLTIVSFLVFFHRCIPVPLDTLFVTQLSRIAKVRSKLYPLTDLVLTLFVLNLWLRRPVKNPALRTLRLSFYLRPQMQLIPM